MFNTLRWLCCFVTLALLVPTHSVSQDNKQNNNILGSAFLISSEGHLLTCAHCITSESKATPDSITVLYQNKEHAAKVLFNDKARDFALLKLDVSVKHALPICLEEPAQGSEVRAFGYPLAMMLGGGIKVTRGSVAGKVELERVKWLQIDAILNPGNSGGALVNESGEVVGITNAILKPEFGQMGFAVPVSEFMAMLNKHNVSYQMLRKTQRLEGPELVKKVAPAVLPILGKPGQNRQVAMNTGRRDRPHLLMSPHLQNSKADDFIDVRGIHGKFPSDSVNFGRMVRDVETEDAMLIGFKVFTRQLFNRTYISGLQPIYRKNGREKHGKAYGSCLVASQVLVARSDYAVGAIRGGGIAIEGTNLVFIDGLQLVFMKVEGKGLDTNDSYQSAAAGNVSGIPKEFFSSEGLIPTGVHAVINHQDDIAAIGLVVKGK
jgi:hypothetical protein